MKPHPDHTIKRREKEEYRMNNMSEKLKTYFTWPYTANTVNIDLAYIFRPQYKDTN